MTLNELSISPGSIDVTNLERSVTSSGVITSGSFIVRDSLPRIKSEKENKEMPPKDTTLSELIKKCTIPTISFTRDYSVKWVDPPKKVPEVDRIIYSGNKTIVIWKDKTKTIVACSEGETYDEFDGFTAALAKKIYGSTCAVKREIKKHKQVEKVKKESA